MDDLKVKPAHVLYPAVVVSLIASYAAYVIAPEEAIMGDIYRILYIHVPSAWICYLAFSLSLICSILFLRNRKQSYDIMAEVAAILGLVYGAVALITGSIWANTVWGLYWNWDPRETTTLILWIAYLGYVSIKLSIGDAGKKAVIGAVYNILAFLTVPLSYLSITLLPTLHPQIVSSSGISITLPMLGTLLVNLVGATIFFVYLFVVGNDVWTLEGRVEALLHEHEMESE
ncbi:MAG: cytochrome c biogenesis protein [Methanomicrobiales archaeon]|nr:cytochrome c biogenesis protein [Methanomicrobiales archaeon]